MKSKKQRQKWWNSLNSEQQNYHLEKWQGDKVIKRQKKSLRIMKARKLKFDCKKCIHAITESCINHVKIGCTHFADEINEVFGPAY